MSNIIGEPFNKYVADQVLARQKLHGSPQRSNSVLSYLNSKTAYIKLTSGVMVTDRNRLSLLGIPDAFMGTQLAKNFIMFSGVSDIRNTMNSDIARTETFINEFAYGLGGLEMGLKPMPGITSIETKYRNRGSIREGTVIMKAFNRKQFEIISLLYLRLGFPILLEWGHTISLDSSKPEAVIDFNSNYSIANEFLNRNYKDDNAVLDALEAKRKESSGNYDAMYGRVTNFDWKFMKDGTYNITLKIISVGAVVESLKMNVYTGDNVSTIKSGNPSQNANDEKPKSDLGWVFRYKNSHNIGNYIYNLISKGYRTHEVKKNTTKGITTYQNKDTKNIDIFYVTKPSLRYYIRLGSLLEFIQNNIILQNVDNQGNPKPILNIDYDTYSNYMYTEDHQLSSDPRICIVGCSIPSAINTPLGVKGKYRIFSWELANNPFKYQQKGVNVGLPMNIYINVGQVLGKLDSLKNETGDVSLSDLLNSILNDVNKALGNVNQLEFIVDENVGKIIDATPIPGSDKLIKKELDEKGVPKLADDSPKFDVFGYYENNTANQSAGFIRDFSLKTEITNGLASMITIGATANGSVVGADATAFSRWNSGLLPIVNQNIIYPNGKPDLDKKVPTLELVKRLDKANEQLVIAYFKYVIDSENNDLNEDDFDNYPDLVTNYLDHLSQLKNLLNRDRLVKVASATSSKGFLPISLQLTLDGISGIKIYQKIQIDTTYLPLDYPTSLKFIIKGVTHKVSSKGWLIDIDTISVPVIEFFEDQNKEGMASYRANTPPTPNVDNRADARTTNADVLRKTLEDLGYREKGKEISSSGTDISSSIEKAASQILRTIKSELPNLKVVVTGGNDKFHQEKSPTSRHTKGNAIDFTIAPVTPANLDSVVIILRRYAAGNSPNFRYIDEYRNLSKHGTGNHFHLSWGAGTEGQTALNESIKLAQEGKIKPITIT